MTTQTEFESYKRAISENFPSFSGAHATADGLKLCLEKTSYSVIHDMFYGVWKSDDFVTNVFLFVPCRKIATAIFNAPGCMHDSQDLSGVDSKKIWKIIKLIIMEG